MATATSISRPRKALSRPRLVGACKYGENPWMWANLFAMDEHNPLAIHKFTLVEGADRSFINLTDVDSLLQIITHIAAGYEQNFGHVPLIAVAVKHGNACGAAVGSDPAEVIRKMVAGDKRAIFGAVVMTNFPVSRMVAEALTERDTDDPMPARYDGVFAPAFAKAAAVMLNRKQGKCRMMVNPLLAKLTAGSIDTTPRKREVRGGYLEQSNYTHILELGKSKLYGRELTDQQRHDLVLAWAIGCVSTSNTIALTQLDMLIGLGVGQQDRIGAVELALKRAHDAGHSSRKAKVRYDGQRNPQLLYFVEGAVAYSDSFFPAPDGPEALAKAGVKAVFTSSGSLNDGDAIYVCGWHHVSLLMQPDAKVRGFAKH